MKVHAIYINPLLMYVKFELFSNRAGSSLNLSSTPTLVRFRGYSLVISWCSVDDVHRFHGGLLTPLSRKTWFLRLVRAADRVAELSQQYCDLLRIAMHDVCKVWIVSNRAGPSLGFPGAPAWCVDRRSCVVAHHHLQCQASSSVVSRLARIRFRR